MCRETRRRHSRERELPSRGVGAGKEQGASPGHRVGRGCELAGGLSGDGELEK